MVEHQSDPYKIAYPNAPGPSTPKDYGEVFDFVVRNGPLTKRDITQAISSMSADSIHDALRWCEKNGYLTSEGADFTEYGTTRDLWYVPVDNDE